MELRRTLFTLGLLPRTAFVAKLGDFGIVGRRLVVEALDGTTDALP